MRARGQQFVSVAIASLVFAEACRPGVANALTAELVASGLSQPLFVTAPPGDNTHIYIVQQTGQILRLDLITGQLTTFFTIGGLTNTNGEQGLLGMAFDPNLGVALTVTKRIAQRSVIQRSVCGLIANSKTGGKG